MSTQYPGGVVSKTPPVPTQATAPGIWTLEQQAYWQARGQWPNAGYQISRSLRFNRSDSAYLTRTPTATGSRTTYTLSLWIKLGNFTTGNDSFMWSSGDATSGDAPSLFWKTYAGSCYFGFTAGTSTDLATTSVYRDPSAWYHVVVAVDTTQATSSNRIKMYVNGTQITAFSTATYPSQNLTYNINTSSYPAYLGCLYAAGNVRFWEGYQTEVNFIDGQALTPSSFGETYYQTGVWQPKAYTGTYGTNGFYLNFSDNSNTTAATLGKDYSGNGNNWTPNNFSVTAGAGNDSLVDVPTRNGVDTGVGGTVRGNYCTMNPLALKSSVTLSNGNLDAYSVGSTDICYGTMGMSSGKWYWEVTCVSGNPYWMIGISKNVTPLADWQTTNGFGYFGSNGQKYTNSVGSSYGASFTTNDIIGVALDMDAGTLTYYKNGTSQGTAFSGLSGTYFASFQNPGANNQVSFNFGQRPFAYTAPSGFQALCTQNLPTPAIGSSSTTLANKNFNYALYTGNGSTQTVTVGFQPDLVWLKNRSSAGDHGLYDVLRGATNRFVSNSTNPADTISGVTAFTSNGFTLGADYNNSGSSFIAWNWKANGAGVTNNAGSITSTVSANTTSGFSIVSFTGTNTNATVGHGLGVAPAMIIMKNRTAVDGWQVYHISLPSAAYRAQLQSTAAADSQPTVWNSTAPTSNAFSVGTNVGNYTQIAYCFAPVAGFSAFGSYTGNSSTDGPFLNLGFTPAYILIKQTSGAGTDWRIITINTSYLSANTTAAEYDSPPGPIRGVSNGVKIVGTGNDINGNGNTYIYAAFATTPFKFALAQPQ